MRRRALLAASTVSGGGGGEEPFYAEFFFDYCEESPLGGYCERAADALSLECYEIGKALVEKYGEEAGYNLMVLTNPLDYGFEVYIEGALSIKISVEYGTLFFMSETEYMGGIYRDGTLINEY